MYQLEKSNQFKKFQRAWISSLRCIVFIYHPDVLKLIFKRSGKEFLLGIWRKDRVLFFS